MDLLRIGRVRRVLLAGAGIGLITATPVAAKIVILGNDPSGWEFTTVGSVNSFLVIDTQTGIYVPAYSHVINYGTGGFAQTLDTTAQKLGQSYVTTFLNAAGAGGRGERPTQFASTDSDGDLA